jgi:hypothetical protein
MATLISDPAVIDAMMDDTTIQAKKTELENFLTVCMGRPELLHSICSIGAMDGYSLDPECCAPVSDALLRKAMTKCVERILAGCYVNGKDGHFSNGFMGSRWLDLNVWAQQNGLTYCRCAFYSKKFSKDWKGDKPYRIMLTVEKAK